jgi:hypothetical protein
MINELQLSFKFHTVNITKTKPCIKTRSSTAQNRTNNITWHSKNTEKNLKVTAKKGKDIPVTNHGGPQGYERLRLSHCLDKRLIDGGKVVSPTRWPHFTPRFLYF